jgi:hypothetical protein
MVVLAMPHSWALGAERSARVHVDYTASSLSVEAHHVSVQDVLVAVGNQVGFQAVIIGEINSPVIHLSLHETSVEDVLDTLLGGRNYGMSYHTASGQPGHGIDKVFVLGSPESEGAVTSRVVTMGGHYPSSTQDSPSSFTELRIRHQNIFNQWRKNRSLNAQHEQNQQEPLHLDPNIVRQHQQEIEKARSLFDTLRQANQIQGVHGRATPPSHLTRANGELEQDLESFHDVLMEMTRQHQQ